MDESRKKEIIEDISAYKERNGIPSDEPLDGDATEVLAAEMWEAGTPWSSEDLAFANEHEGNLSEGDSTSD